MAIELIFNLVLGIGIVFFLIQSLQLPASDNPSDVLGAGGFPTIVGILALIVLVIITTKVIKEKKKVYIPLLDFKSADGRTLILSIVALAAYIALLDVIGFTLATLLYLLVAPVVIGYRKWIVLAVFAVVATAVLVFVFGTVFYVPLPRGVGFLREFSYAIY